LCCVNRNAQQQPSTESNPTTGDSVTPGQIRQAQQHQYDEIPLGQTQRGPAARPYAPLNPETQGEQHQYVPISQRQTDRGRPTANYLQPNT